MERPYKEGEMTETQLVEYNVTDVVIAEMEKAYMCLTIKDFDDTEGFQAVHEARMVVKGKRVEVEKRRKALKADALAYGKLIDSEAKKVFTKLEPIETHLQTEEDKVINEKKRIKEEEEAKEREKIQSRLTILSGYGKIVPFFDAAAWTDEEFVETVDKAKAEYEEIQQKAREEAAQIVREEEARKAEDERLAKERAELEAERKRIAAEQAEAQAKIDEANRKIEAEKAAIEAEKKAEQERKDREKFEKDAKEKAEREAKAKAERDEQERLARERAETEEKARQESLKPDKDKLIDFAGRVLALATYKPDLESPVAQHIYNEAIEGILIISDQIKKETEAL